MAATLYLFSSPSLLCFNCNVCIYDMHCQYIVMLTKACHAPIFFCCFSRVTVLRPAMLTGDSQLFFSVVSFLLIVILKILLFCVFKKETLVMTLFLFSLGLEHNLLEVNIRDAHGEFIEILNYLVHK